jgi:hypothetical protein
MAAGGELSSQHPVVTFRHQRRGLELDVRVLLHVQEVGRLDILVALGCPLEKLAASISARAVEAVTGSAMVTSPESTPKVPLTTPSPNRCRAVKLTDEVDGPDGPALLDAAIGEHQSNSDVHALIGRGDWGIRQRRWGSG